MREFWILFLLGQAWTSAGAAANAGEPFHFCVSTAAHQIEGRNYNSDWWEWEHRIGAIKSGHTSELATDSWNHIDEDIAHLQALGVDTYRFSIEWAKIEPRENQFDPIEINRYIEFIKKLRAKKIEPMVTLYHFTLPRWVSDRGGWEWDGIVPAFDRFAAEVAKKFHEQIPRGVKTWNTLNEPMTIIAAAYISDVFPPAKNDLGSIGKPMINMVRAHARAYHRLHEILDHGDFKILAGIAHHLRVFEPRRAYSPLDRYFTRKFDEVFNWAIPLAVSEGQLKLSLPWILNIDESIADAANTQDFFGLNYYSRDLISFELFAHHHLQRSTPEGAPLSDLGWEIYPAGLGLLLDEIHQRFPKLPIWITENGIAENVVNGVVNVNDEKRTSFIRDHLKVIQSELSKGMPIAGYCHWTLNDNFEWAEGYTAKFGLYSLEPLTLRRIPKKSAQDFRTLVDSFPHL